MDDLIKFLRSSIEKQKMRRCYHNLGVLISKACKTYTFDVFLSLYTKVSLNHIEYYKYE